MKKFFTVIFLLVFTITALHLTDFSIFAENNGLFNYSISNGNAIITGLVDKNTSGAIEIPNKIGGCQVNAIGENAFYNCALLSHVTMPDTITEVGKGAFEKCSGLKSIIISENISEIGYHVFSGCNGLLSVNIPNGVTHIGSSAFSNCTSITNFNIPNSVTSINNYAFSNCSSIVKISIPDSVTVIGDGVFSGCTSLQEIILPFVGDQRRYPNSGYQFPLGYIFGTYNYSGGICVKQYYDYSKPNSWLIGTDYYIPASLKKVIITDSDYIPRGAFYNCSQLENIEISNKASAIGDDVFANCIGINTLVIPDGVASVGKSAFSGCRNVISIVLPESITTIGENAFINCSNLEDVFYKGSKQQKDTIQINNTYYYNNPLINADWHYNYVLHILGDINDDGEVNNKDLIRLFQYLSDWDIETNNAALDINGDNTVNNKDLTRLFQYLSDWDVKIY